MNPTLLLRVASGLTMLHAVLHTIGGVFSKPDPGPEEAVRAVMKGSAFPVMGMTRTYWDFYFGFGLFISIALAVEAVVFWQLGTLAKSDALRLRPILASFIVAYLCYAAITSTYFFAAPAVFEVLVAALLGLAIAKSK